MFFGKKPSKLSNQTNRKSIAALPEAAFSLLQWAQNGESFDFEKNQISKSDDDGEGDMSMEDNLDQKGSVEEEEEKQVPDWAQSVVASCEDSSKAIPEMDGPKSLKVELRPYQRQALHWMMICEDESKRDLDEQVKLLSELAPNPTTALEPPSTKAIHCECGPVLVNPLVARNCPSVNGDTTHQLTQPLWQRRYLASYDLQKAICFYVQPLFGVATDSPPQPPQPCRGGILADSMGLGKVC